MLWRFTANNTHLYPGALLRSHESVGMTALSPDDELLVEFSDGVSVSGVIPAVESAGVILQMPTYRTRGGTTVTARTWRIMAGGDPGLMRVQERLSGA